MAYFCLMIRAYLNKKIGPRIEKGHPWIYANEVDKLDAEAGGGEIVEVFSAGKKFIGKGYINPRSQILIRLLTRNPAKVINAALNFIALDDPG